MLDGARVKALKKQLMKKDGEILSLKNKIESLEKEKAALREQMKQEQKKLEEATLAAVDTAKKCRDDIFAVEGLHQHFLRLIEKTKETNEQYREEFERLIEIKKAAEGGN